MDFRRDTVAELARRVREREVTAVDMVTHALAQIDQLNPLINAFVSVDADAALTAAGDIDQRIAAGQPVGPLAGVPMGVKDLEDAAGFITTFGSDLHTDDPPAPGDSAVVGLLKAAGAVVVGKTNTPEFGFKGVTDNVPFGATANPWDTRRSPGGSSGGSGAAIASGMVPLATGSDGGGSIRIPSSLCGLTGIKTSQGRVPLGGATPPGSGILSVKGPMARRIRDVALALDTCLVPDPTDVFGFPAPAEAWTPQLVGDLRPGRVAWSPDLGFARVDREVAAIVEAAVRALEAAGTEVVEAPPVFADNPTLDWFTIWTTQRRKAQGHLKGTPDWLRIDPALRDQIEYAERLTAVDLARAIDGAHLHNLALEAAFAATAAPLLLCPTVAGHAPVLGHLGTVDGEETVSWVEFTPVINLTRNPAGSVCAGFTADGLPVGLQVIGRQRDDLGVLRALAGIEDLLGIDRIAPVG